MQNEIKVEKARLRALVEEQMRQLDAQSIAESDRGILEAVCRLPEYRSARRIFTYFSVGREVDTAAIMARAASDGKLVAVPRVYGGGRMDFAAAECLTGQFCGIPQPEADAQALLPEWDDLLLVPALCYDEEGFRLGRGGGYYDRFLVPCAALSVGLCRSALLRPRLPREAHDRPVSILITEKKTTRLLKEPRNG
jgi:5-formyltetrahydrofolate cyclo-ligase